MPSIKSAPALGDERARLQAFAAAAARLADPFADRAALLDAMGMDEAGWRDLESKWRSELQGRARRGDRSLADAFALAFQHERDRIAAERGKWPPAPAAPQEKRGDLDGTAIAEVVLAPALPFTGSRPPPAPAEKTLLGEDLDSTALMEDGDDLGVTLPFEDDP